MYFSLPFCWNIKRFLIFIYTTRKISSRDPLSHSASLFSCIMASCGNVTSMLPSSPILLNSQFLQNLFESYFLCSFQIVNWYSPASTVSLCPFGSTISAVQFGGIDILNICPLSVCLQLLFTVPYTES